METFSILNPAIAPQNGALDASRGRGETRRETRPAHELPSETARRLAAGCLVLDCETTGLGPSAHIWEVAVLRVNPTVPIGLDCWRARLNPGPCTWDERAREMACQSLGSDPVVVLAACGPFSGIADLLISMLAGQDVCGWNVCDYDQVMLQHEFARTGFCQFSQRFQTIRWRDLMELYICWREETGRRVAHDSQRAKRYSLAAACNDEAIEQEIVHLALTGAHCAAAILQRMAGEGEARAGPPPLSLHEQLAKQ